VDQDDRTTHPTTIRKVAYTSRWCIQITAFAIHWRWQRHVVIDGKTAVGDPASGSVEEKEPDDTETA
jgi:hypothetical protein